jgi:hypothetical protein
MKKTTCIQLVLITAALAACNRHLYQQDVPQAETSDSTDSCPLTPEDLPPDYYMWFYGFQPYGMYYEDPYYLEGYYYYREHRAIIRHGFGRTGVSGHSGHSGHS